MCVSHNPLIMRDFLCGKFWVNSEEAILLPNSSNRYTFAPAFGIQPLV